MAKLYRLKMVAGCLSMGLLLSCNAQSDQSTIQEQKTATAETAKVCEQPKSSWALIRAWREWWQAYVTESCNQLNRTADYLVSCGCKEVSESNYPNVFVDIKEIAQRAGIKAPRIFVIDGKSRDAMVVRMPEYNAMAMGIDQNIGLMLISKSLVDALTRDELKGVVAHECAHILKTHSRTLLKVAIPSALASALATVEIWRAGSALGRKRFYPLIVAVWLAPRILINAVSRSCENEADATAVRLSRSKALGTALDKLEKHNSEENPFSYKFFGVLKRWAPFLISHPTTEQRKKNIEKINIES